MYRELARTDDAVKSFKEALRLKPSFAEAHQNLAIFHLYQSQYAEGIENLRAAIRIKPDLALAHKLLGLAYLAVDSRDKALEEYSLLKSLDLEMSNFLYSAIQRPEKFTFGVVPGKLISTPTPEYSPAARKAHLSGRVTVVVEIDEDGRVTSARASNGPPELARAAEAAALKARFVPTKLSGTPVKVKGVINYNFGP
jgi:TonB family protein